MRKIAFLVFICLMINVCFVSAMSAESLTVVSDRDTGYITVSGNTGVTGKIYVQTYITKPEITSDLLTAASFDSVVLTLGSVVTSQNGDFTMQLKLPRVNQTGNYTAHVATTTQSVISKDFYYNSPYDVTDALEAFSRYTANEADLFQTKLEEVASLFSLDMTLYNGAGFQKGELAAAMIADRPASGYDSISAFAKLFYAQVHTQLLDDTATPHTYLTEQKENLPVDERYHSLSSAAHTALDAKISAANLTRFSQLTTLLSEAMLPAAFTTASVWNDYATLCASFSDLISLPADYQTKLQTINASDVYKNMFGNRMALTSNALILQEYQKQIDIVAQGGTSIQPGVGIPVVGGGGGGGGGGFGGGGVSAGGGKSFISEELKTPVTPAFSDLGSVSWAVEAISMLQEKGIISGYPDGTFRPDDLITREEFVKITVSALGFTAGEAEASFRDVPAGSWYESYVKIACANGIVNGIGDSLFGTGSHITRQDLITMAYRSAQKLGVSFSERSIPTDYEQIAEYAKEPVVKLMGAGIVNGKGDNLFDPTGYATRAETAKIVYLLLNYR